MNKGWLGVGVVLMGCAGADGEDGARGKAGENASASLRDATKAECPSGGSVLEIGVGDEVEETTICDGEDGAEGEPGEDGAQGPQGERGPRGDAGASAEMGLGAVVSRVQCGGSLEGTDLYFSYMTVQFADGSVWASGAIRGLNIQGSDSVFYTSEQAGSLTAPVTIVFDVSGDVNAGFWTIEVDREHLLASLVYSDSDLADPMTWTAVPNACNVAD